MQADYVVIGAGSAGCVLANRSPPEEVDDSQEGHDHLWVGTAGGRLFRRKNINKFEDCTIDFYIDQLVKIKIRHNDEPQREWYSNPMISMSCKYVPSHPYR